MLDMLGLAGWPAGLMIDQACGACRLMTSIHALKPKQKSKSGIAESTSVNAAAPDSDKMQHTPLTHNSANKDNGNLESSLMSLGSDAVSANISPSAKKPKGEVGAAKVVVDKKKNDVRKKSLKRL